MINRDPLHPGNKEKNGINNSCQILRKEGEDTANVLREVADVLVLSSTESFE